MNAKRVSAAAGVVFAAQQTRQTAAGIAAALESACLLQSPETAAELESLRKLPELLREALAGAAVADDLRQGWQRRAETAEARVAELETLLAEGGSSRPVDEDPIAHALTEQAEGVSPQVQKLRGILAPQREDRYESPLHHDYKVPHDLPKART